MHFLIEEDAGFAILQSRIHLIWAMLQGRTTGGAGTASYSSTKCFETFPPPFPWNNCPASLTDIAGLVLEKRAQVMIHNKQGLTATYNRLKDSQERDAALLQLRAFHIEMDRAVLAAYGWTDLEVPPYPDAITASERGAYQVFAGEIINRLYILNAERTAEEAKTQDPPAKKPSHSKKKSKFRKKKPSKPDPQGALF